MPVRSRRRSPSRRTYRVSVVVPVYNPGKHIEPLLDSLAGQSMPAQDFEVVFVDDGSTDDTGSRLDAVVASHPTWAVVHIPNSGWPGHPRNVGLDRAAGEYVAFVDHDDYLAPRALELVHAFAVRHDSDVVVAREIGVGHAIGRAAFRRTVPDADLATDPVLRVLTPHKLYRRALLDCAGIRFPEGKVRLEDHLFNVRAYFAAGRVSLYADTPYYYWTRREDVAHASSQPIDPHEYYEVALNGILDVVDQHTEPGPRRDRIKAHWLEKKLLAALAGRAMLAYEPSARQRVHAVVRRIVAGRFAPGSFEHLPAASRVRAALLLEAGLPDLLAFAQAERRTSLAVTCHQARLGRRHVTVELSLTPVHDDGSPVAFVRAGERVRWVAPTALPLVGGGLELLDVTDSLSASKVFLLLNRRGDVTDHWVPGTVRIRFEPIDAGGRVAVHVDSRIRFRRKRLRRWFGDARRPILLDLRAELDGLDWSGIRRLPAAPPFRDRAPAPGRAELYRTSMGNLSIRLLPRTRRR